MCTNNTLAPCCNYVVKYNRAGVYNNLIKAHQNTVDSDALLILVTLILICTTINTFKISVYVYVYIYIYI